MAGNVRSKLEMNNPNFQREPKKVQKIDAGGSSRDEVVKLNIDIECSRDFVEKLLREYTLTIKSSSPQERQLKFSYPSKRNGSLLLLDSGDPAGYQTEQPERPEKLERQSRWVDRVLFGTLLLIFASMGGVVGKMYLERGERQLSVRTMYDTLFKNDRPYRRALIRNLNALVSKLDELTSVPRMGEAFPEITSLSTVVIAKRGSDPAEQALAAIEYIWRVKDLFDRWVEGSRDLPPELRPTQKEISYFLSLWKETKALLDHIQTARSGPMRLLNTKNDRGNDPPTPPQGGAFSARPASNRTT
ncbi:MAG: hypothetical protein JRH06_06245 [Deltaproteobacteria bacterium]|nr:hypothetical protein [Deltaproteobacteria bacterium]MBW2137138.1 hypothetical protein [Deltaproteobacteria bacterium]